MEEVFAAIGAQDVCAQTVTRVVEKDVGAAK